MDTALPPRQPNPRVQEPVRDVDHQVDEHDDEGNEHPLTASEFGLLKVFAANPKRVLSRERLLELAMSLTRAQISPTGMRLREWIALEHGYW